jgi:hypothetical protein
VIANHHETVNATATAIETKEIPTVQTRLASHNMIAATAPTTATGSPAHGVHEENEAADDQTTTATGRARHFAEKSAMTEVATTIEDGEKTARQDLASRQKGPEAQLVRETIATATTRPADP